MPTPVVMLGMAAALTTVICYGLYVTDNTTDRDSFMYKYGHFIDGFWFNYGEPYYQAPV